jgi:hypothetical protein
MLIRMTGLVSALASIAAAGALATSSVFGAGSGDGAGVTKPRTAVVIDASAARDGRELVDPRLRGLDADVRLPRTATEALTDVRYFAAQGYDRIVVAGPDASAAAGRAHVAATSAADLPGALAALRR